jgi:hypothetical protein
MTEIEWQPLPTPMWPSPAMFADVGEFELLVFTNDGVPNGKSIRGLKEAVVVIWSPTAPPIHLKPRRRRLSPK